MPKSPIDEQSYSRGRFVDPKKATIDALWDFDTPNWKALPGSCRSRFVDEKLLHADEVGAELALNFEGRAVGAYVLAGPDAGTVEVRVDGGEFTKIDLYHRFSRGLHYPRTVMFATDLTEGKHTLHLRISDAHNEASKGNVSSLCPRRKALGTYRNIWQFGRPELRLRGHPQGQLQQRDQVERVVVQDRVHLTLLAGANIVMIGVWNFTAWNVTYSSPTAEIPFERL